MLVQNTERTVIMDAVYVEIHTENIYNGTYYHIKGKTASLICELASYRDKNNAMKALRMFYDAVAELEIYKISPQRQESYNLSNHDVIFTFPAENSLTN